MSSQHSPPSPPSAAKQRRRTLAQDAVNLPNLLTFGRVVAIPFLIWLLDAPSPVRGYWASIVFTAAAITDMLDGYLARKLGVVSVLGKFLDPLADKLIVMAALVWMVPMGRIPAWVVVLLLAREISVTGLRSVAASEGVVISAGQEGKMKTALQMIGIVALVLGYPYHLSYLGIDLGVVDMVHVGRLLIYLSLLFSFASAAQYVRLFAAAVEAKEQRARRPERVTRSRRAGISLRFLGSSAPPRCVPPPSPALLLLALVASMTAAVACSNQGEGEVCDADNGSNDCQDGLVCEVRLAHRRQLRLVNATVLPALDHSCDHRGVLVPQRDGDRRGHRGPGRVEPDHHPRRRSGEARPKRAPPMAAADACSIDSAGDVVATPGGEHRRRRGRIPGVTVY